MIAPRVLLADDHPLFREALRAAVSRVRRDFVIEQTETFAGARQALLRDPEIELVLLDLKLPDCDGLVGLASLRAEFPHTPVVVVSANQEPTTVSNSIAVGALGFIPKSAPLALIAEALSAILDGDIWTPADLRLPPPDAAARALVALSPAQVRLMPCLGRGLSNKRIALELGVPEATVKTHLNAAFRKLGVASRTQAMLLIAPKSQSDPPTSA